MTPTARPAAAGRLARAVTAAGLGGAGLLLAAPAAGAVTVPPGVYVVDEAQVLTPAEEQRLTNEITALGLQAFLTGTDRALFSALEGRSQNVHVRDGALEAG